LLLEQKGDFKKINLKMVAHFMNRVHFFLLFLGEKLNRWKDYIEVVVNSINNAKKLT